MKLTARFLHAAHRRGGLPQCAGPSHERHDRPSPDDVAGGGLGGDSGVERGVTGHIRESWPARLAIPLPVAPAAVDAAHGLFSSRIDRTGMGTASGDGQMVTDKKTGEYSFTYSTTLPWLIWNEYHNANVEPDPTLFYRLIKPGPYNFQVIGARAFLRFADKVDLCRSSLTCVPCPSSSKPGASWPTKSSINSASTSKTPCGALQRLDNALQSSGLALRTFGGELDAWNSQAEGAVTQMKEMATAANADG